MRLGAADLEEVLAFLEEAQAVHGPAAFTPELLDRLAELTESTYATFSDANYTTHTISEYVPCSAEGDGPRDDLEWWTCAQSVAVRRYKATNGAGPVVLSDLFSRRQRTRTDFNGNFRDYGVADEIHVDLDPDRGWSVGLGVSRDRDYGTRERLILQLLRPHLAALYRAAALRRRVARATATFDPDAALELTPREREVMLCVRDGLTNAEIASLLVVEQSTVRKHLEHVYEKLGVRSRTAALAKLRGGEI